MNSFMLVLYKLTPELNNAVGITSLAVFIKRSQAGAQISALIKLFNFLKKSIC